MGHVCNPDNGWIPPVLLPGMDDAAWCITSCNPCDTIQRRYSDCGYIEITPKVAKTFIRMLASRQNPVQADPTRSRIYIEIRRRGCATQLACYDAFQRTADGYVGFYWDSTFTSAQEGLYVGDVYVECNYCFSIKFRIPRCELVVDHCYNEYLAEDCGAGECSMLTAVGDGVVGGVDCVTAPDASECGLPAPYFETRDPVVLPEAAQACNLSCQPAFSIVGDDIVGDI
jgi:hypothetical protein